MEKGYVLVGFFQTQTLKGSLRKCSQEEWRHGMGKGRKPTAVQCQPQPESHPPGSCGSTLRLRNGFHTPATGRHLP